MQERSIPLNEDYSIQIYQHISEINEVVWNSITEKIFFYQTHQFLQIVESIHPQIRFRYILVYQNDSIVAALYFQLLDFSFRNLVNYNATDAAAWKKKFKLYIAAKNTKLLNLGNVFFTGDRGIICQHDEVIIPEIPKIFEIAHNSFSTQKPKAYLLANINLQDEVKCYSFGKSAFHPFATEPDMYLKIDESWLSFDDYLASLSSKYRVRTKKILSVSADISVKDLSLQEIMEHNEVIQKLYTNVVNHVAFNMASLNIEFFKKVKALYADKCRILAYIKDNIIVGFACLFNVDTITLHVHYIGLDYDINKSYKLYNRMLLDFVKFAIDNGKKQVHFGRTATEIKTTIGAVPQPLHAFLKMKNPVFNTSLPYFLRRIKPPEYTVRNPFK